MDTIFKNPACFYYLPGGYPQQDTGIAGVYGLN